MRSIAVIVAVAVAVAVAALLASACATKPPPPPYRVTFTALADGEPLAGVGIAADGQRLGTTGADGVLFVKMQAADGLTLPLRVTCPEGYRPPKEMPVLTVHRFAGLDPEAEARGVQVTLECSPAERKAVLAVRTGRPGLRVLVHGQEVATTNTDGVAHAVVKLPPDSPFRVVLDTSVDPRLRPQNPAFTLALASADDILTVDQAFAVDEPPRPPPRRRVKKRPIIKKVPPPPSGPIKL